MRPEAILIQESKPEEQEQLKEESEKPEYEDTSYSEESEENFDWYNQEEENDTWFVLVNNDRKTIQEGDQACYCYGNRSNNYLMSSYGFCFPDNRFDSYTFKILTNLEDNPMFYDRQDSKQNYILALIAPNLDNRAKNGELIVKLKRDQLNTMLIAFLKHVLRHDFTRKEKEKNEYGFEKYVFTKYYEVLEYLLSLEEQKSTL